LRLTKAQSRKTKSKKIPDPSPSLTHIFFSLSRFLPATFRQINQNRREIRLWHRHDGACFAL
jgi:hypothetical protein